MNLIQLIIVNIKRMLKDPLKVGLMLIMPIAVILFVNFLEGGDSHQSSKLSNVTVAYNIEDEGDLWETIYSSPSKSQWIFQNEKDKALELLESNEVAVVYNIPSNFTEKINNYEKPIIESYKREEGNITIPLEMDINNKINEFIKEKLLIDKGIISNKEDLYILKTETLFERNQKIVTGDLHTATMLLIYFIILGASPIVTELMEFKKKNIISRSITTPNKSSVILGSIALSLLFFQVAANILVVLLGAKVTGYNIVNLPIIFINFILASLFSITLSLAMTRIFNNEGSASMVTALVAILTLFLSMFAQDGIYQNIPEFIKNLGKFTPQYWMFDSLEKSVIFPNVLIVLLIVLALFTAGSYRLKDFVRK
ncbi:ABC transporter permease [Tissierella carlieri]|uniref:ABC transporter permease n=1 Tax=Tissierella carlieri TaxID=689904 RepID=UPI001C121FED|nr:ABC transporter permease [Tissierella carlieri]MBU5311439.1 ABC transporter permease [Tissierella carlieri]